MSAKPKHTQGPWVDGGCYSTIRGKRRNVVVQTEAGQVIAEVRSVEDAHLVLAAPDMLEAAKAFLSACGSGPDEPDFVALGEALAKTRACLKKARGQ